MADSILMSFVRCSLSRIYLFSASTNRGEYFSRIQSRAFISGAAIARSVLLIFVIFVHVEP